MIYCIVRPITLFGKLILARHIKTQSTRLSNSQLTENQTHSQSPYTSLFYISNFVISQVHISNGLCTLSWPGWLTLQVVITYFLVGWLLLKTRTHIGWLLPIFAKDIRKLRLVYNFLMGQVTTPKIQHLRTIFSESHPTSNNKISVATGKNSSCNLTYNWQKSRLQPYLQLLTCN
jgi:hypothetical protein